MKITIHKDLDDDHTCMLIVSILQSLVDTNTQRILQRRSTDINFFLVELPALGKAIDRSLSTSVLCLDDVRFKKKKKTQLPLFAYPIMNKIYDDDGVLRPSFPINQLRLLRQICFLAYKLEREFDDEAQRSADIKFLNTDQAVKDDHTDAQINALEETFRDCFPQRSELIPSYGNGAVAEKLTNYAKRAYRTNNPDLLSSGLSKLLYQDVAHINATELSEANVTSRLIHIPKDSRGPRSISIQPSDLLTYQLAIMKQLYNHIESESSAAGRINFTDQTINQRLAQVASKDQSYCTIDLKDASDLVPWNLVRDLLPYEWYSAIVATRSPNISVDGDIVELKKFASMGSALCFPIEAMLFYSICKLITNDVYVYGDDIIVPNQHYNAVTQKLIEYGLAVNMDKSLHTGLFRESCGGEFYDGEDISVVKLKGTSAVQLIPFLNNLKFQGIFNSNIVDQTMSWYENITQTWFYRGERDGLKSVTFHSDYDTLNSVRFKRRWNSDLHFFEIRVPQAKAVQQDESSISELDRLYDWFRQRADQDQFNDHPHRANDWFGVSPTTAEGNTSAVGFTWIPFG